jgi:hypothetical protein
METAYVTSGKLIFLFLHSYAMEAVCSEALSSGEITEPTGNLSLTGHNKLPCPILIVFGYQ